MYSDHLQSNYRSHFKVLHKVTGTVMIKTHNLPAIEQHHKSQRSAEISACACNYPATLDVVVFLLQTLLDTGLIFVCDEDETPPFL